MLNHCGGQGREWGQWRIKVVFFKNEYLTCKLVTKKKKNKFKRFISIVNRLEKGVFLDKTLPLKTQEP